MTTSSSHQEHTLIILIDEHYGTYTLDDLFPTGIGVEGNQILPRPLHVHQSAKLALTRSFLTGERHCSSRMFIIFRDKRVKFLDSFLVLIQHVALARSWDPGTSSIVSSPGLTVSKYHVLAHLKQPVNQCQ